MEDILVMTRQQVRDFDQLAINILGVPGIVLMENAGRGCAEVVAGMGETDDSLKKAGIFCGTGNNGGDGFVIGRQLLNWGLGVQFIICGDRDRISGDALTNLKILENINADIKLVDLQSPDLTDQLTAIIDAGNFDVVVDAIFGTGLSGDIRGGYADVIKAVNSVDVPIVAVDIPSGLDCDTGLPLNGPDGQPIAVKADATVTFVAVKKGFYDCTSSADYTGEVFVASIGVEPEY